MRVHIQETVRACSPQSLARRLCGEPGVVMLSSGGFDAVQGRYSFVTARPFLTLRSFGERCELDEGHGPRIESGNPWQILSRLLGQFDLTAAPESPFPLGGVFGWWGYDLKNFVEPRLPRRAVNDLPLPDCAVGFYASLVVFDHLLGNNWIVSTGLGADGSQSEERQRSQTRFWEEKLGQPPEVAQPPVAPAGPPPLQSDRPFPVLPCPQPALRSTCSRPAFLAAVEHAQRYIRAGDIYQVNLSQRLTAPWPGPGWEFFERLAAVSPAPFAAYLDGGDFQIASSSPELFLRISGTRIRTRPIKGTRPRSADPGRDAQLSCELQTSPKEMAELVMITDLLRNDLGKVCAYGSVHVPELARLERFAHVQHLISTVEGRLRPEVTPLAALAACFPGGSITGAPKIRAMEIIDELEPVARGPYTGCLGYLGFNRESQFSIIIRTALCAGGQVHFQVGAGIVADSSPEAEYEETMAKAGGFRAALQAGEGQAASPAAG